MKFLIVLLITLAHANLFNYTMYELTFDQKALQEKIANHFPIQKVVYYKDTQIELGNLLLTDPVVTLSKDSERIEISVHFEFMPAHTHAVIKGETTAASKISYEPSNYSFYLNEPEVEDLSVSHLGEFTDRKIATYVNHKLPQWIKKHGPVYKFGGNMTGMIGSATIQQVKVRNGILVIKMGLGEASPDPDPKTLKPVPSDEPGIDIWQLASPPM